MTIVDLNNTPPPWRKNAEGEKFLEDMEASRRDKVSADEMTAEMQRRLSDPLFDLAARFRDMPAKDLRAFCRGLHNPALQDTLIDWALAYLDGKEIPVPTPSERRI